MRNKKVLFVATVVKTHIRVFHVPFLEMFKEMGYETAVAAKNDYENPDDCVIPFCDTYFDVPFSRSPFSLANIKAYRELKSVIDSGKYDIIHCHTPVGSILSRIAARRATKKGTRVIYTAHGFHFCKGSKLLNWLLFYPVEKLCSRMTDTLITINKEDYELAKSKMKAARTEYVPGVGIDISKFRDAVVDRAAKRAEIGVPENSVLFLSVGELNQNKNHENAIKAIAELEDRSIHYAIAGRGEYLDKLKNLVGEMKMEDRVHFLGYRSDLPELYKASDIFLFPSFREGLSVSVMEAMACGMPIALSRIRGNTDLVDEKGGVFFEPGYPSDIRAALEKILSLNREELGRHNQKESEKYSLESIMRMMKDIYF